jgi:hypothetical protein
MIFGGDLNLEGYHLEKLLNVNFILCERKLFQQERVLLLSFLLEYKNYNFRGGEKLFE